MTLPSIIEGNQAHYETQRRLSEEAYARQLGLRTSESLLQRLMRRLRKLEGGEMGSHKPQVAGGIKTQRPPAYSK